MRYFLYLHRSFIRAWREQVLLLVVMTLAFALPLGMSVLAESCRYGGEQWYIDFSNGGYPVRIAHVTAENAAFFDSLEGFTPIYSAGDEVLFLKPDPSLHFGEDVEELGIFVTRLHAIFEKIAASGGSTSLVEEIYSVYTENPLIAQYRTFTLVLLLFSAVTQCAFYTLHLHKHTKAHGALLSMGATRTQLSLLTAAHLALLLFLSAGLALLFSIGGMRLLIDAYFSGVSDSSFWILFHCTPSVIAGICIVCFVVPLLYGAIRVYTMTGCPVRELLGADVSGEKLRHDRKVLSARQNVVSMLSGMLRRRCGSRSRICCAILFPVVTLVLFLSIYEGTQCLSALREDRVDIRVISGTNPPQFTEEEIAKIVETANAADYRENHSLARFVFTLFEQSKKQNRPKTGGIAGRLQNQRNRETQISLQKGDTTTPKGAGVTQNENGKAIYHAVVRVNGVPWEVGEQKCIAQREIPMDSYANAEAGVTMKADNFYVIADRVIESEDVSEGDAVVYLYSDAYDAFVAELEISSLDITLRDTEKHMETAEALRALAEEIPMQVVDHSNAAEIALQRAKGEAIFAGLVIVLLCVFYAILVRSILVEYMRSQRANMRTLYTIGTDMGTLRQAYTRQMRRAAVVIVLSVTVVCAVLLLLYANSDTFAMQKLVGFPPMLYILAFTAASGYTTAAMVLPIRLYRDRRQDAVQGI